MKHLTATSVLCLLLFCSAFVAGQGTPTAPEWADSLRSVYLYTEGIKQQNIIGDSARARALFREAIEHDSTFAPAYYELAVGLVDGAPAEAAELARQAHLLDTTNKWYHQFYGQALLYSERYDLALSVFRRLQTEDPTDPDNYRILAALYERNQQPFSAIAALDSAEVRFGLIPLLSNLKRRLLVSTHQIDKAINEAQVLVQSVPYESEHHVMLAALYSIAGKDSLALIQYNEALQIDSTSLPALMALADFHSERRDYLSLLSVTRRMFEVEALSVEEKIKRFEQFTSNTRFYREYYPQLNDLVSMLAIRYPQEQSVVLLYGQHLIASGQLQEALDLYKLHIHDLPPKEEYFRIVISIESYLQRPDSTNIYINRALALFPNQPEFRIAKGNALAYSKQHAEAIKAYKESLRYADTDSLRGVIWGIIGDTWHQAAIDAGEVVEDFIATAPPKRPGGRKAVAENYKAYERSLRYNPDNILVLNNYAYFLALENRELEKALAMSSRVVALSDNNPTYMDTHAWVLFRLGRPAEAKKILQQAIALDNQNSPELMVHYGDILNALGERFLAETYWGKALEKGYSAEAIKHRMESGK